MNRNEVCKLKHTNHELMKIISEFVIDNIVHVLYNYLNCITNRDKLLCRFITFEINFHNL